MRHESASFLKVLTRGISLLWVMQRAFDYNADSGSCHCDVPHYDSHEYLRFSHRPL